ncbi:hypothetical protein BD410DRAFT_191451 [Rickenella mellea]|uniref:Uncharacterized protein n=1 Tax=Rickenella mellea TaxID=50990 RepID=A0A4Y7PHQ4_9AGAM|nr:hypothetical protein BD410DRAFT_191451 [Rickenella mellea]
MRNGLVFDSGVCTKMSIVATETDSSKARLHGQAAPILLIPCEITSEIFQHCLPEDGFPRPSVKCAPTQLSRVCSTWHNLAIRTPRLWPKIFLCTSPQDGGDPKRSLTAISHVKALEVWMTRATPFLLSVHLRYPTLPRLPTSEFQLGKLPPVFCVIVDNAARWKDINLSLPQDYLSFAWSLTQQNASNLKSIYLEDTSIPMFGHPLESGSDVVLNADTAESLSTLSVRASILYTSRKPAPFVGLRTLSLKHSSPRNCLHLLKYCPVLESLNLHFFELAEAHILHLTSPILLPQLRDFHLSHTGYGEHGISFFPESLCGEVGALLDNFELPNLREFYLWVTVGSYMRYYHPELPSDYLSRLIIRSNCSLTTLELRNPHMETRSIVECLQLSPDLKDLGIPADEELERQVTQIMPGLQSLRIFSDRQDENKVSIS